MSSKGALVAARVGALSHVALVGGLAPEVLLVVALEGPQVGVDGRAEPAGELALQLHVLDDGVVAPQSTLVDQILAILRIH